MNYVRSNSLSLKYQGFPISDCQDGLENLNLWQKLNSFAKHRVSLTSKNDSVYSTDNLLCKSFSSVTVFNMLQHSYLIPSDFLYFSYFFSSINYLIQSLITIITREALPELWFLVDMRIF